MRVRVLELGEGTPLLMIHGGGAFASVYASLLARLKGFRVFAVDRPGCGLSEPFEYANTDLRAHAIELVRSVLDALGLERAKIVGNCAGGFFSLSFAIAHPERVERLVLVGAPAGTDPWLPLPSRLLGTPVINVALAKTIFRPSPSSTREVYRRLFVGREDRLGEDLLECAYRAQLVPGASRSFLGIMERLAGPLGLRPAADLRNDLGAIRAPTFFITGTKNAFATPQAIEAVARRLPHADMHVIEEAGHFKWLDEPDRCAHAIERFAA